MPIAKIKHPVRALAFFKVPNQKPQNRCYDPKSGSHIVEDPNNNQGSDNN